MSKLEVSLNFISTIYKILTVFCFVWFGHCSPNFQYVRMSRFVQPVCWLGEKEGERYQGKGRHFQPCFLDGSSADGHHCLHQIYPPKFPLEMDCPRGQVEPELEEEQKDTGLGLTRVSISQNHLLPYRSMLPKRKVSGQTWVRVVIIIIKLVSQPLDRHTLTHTHLQIRYLVTHNG